MAITYLVTGATGHIGFNVIKVLTEKGCKTRALVSPEDPNESRLPERCEIFHGEFTDKSSMEEFFDCFSQDDICVIHCGEEVTPLNHFDQQIWDINVEGTKNILDMCRLYHARRLVFVSSVLALPQAQPNSIVCEADSYETDHVLGLYGKTKAAASQLVLQEATDDFSVSIVMHTFLLGPDDYGRGNGTIMINRMMDGTVPNTVTGGFDFTDVRDVAQGIVACAEKGENKSSYILSNQNFSVQYISELVSRAAGRKTVALTMPSWFVRLSSPVIGVYNSTTRRNPLFSSLGLELFASNISFSSDKAEKELGYTTRDMQETVRDTVAFLKERNKA
ncbi:MAG: NAD-dependent epimerase/dehydratase family protein [Erysipelotrichaceae bacterium]|nr:NAD-dependent epimerase/dehydratase family protein [Erysipelotrichaceae bacterium]